MIQYKDGDLIKMAQDGDFELIGHCANSFCVFGSGIAPQIKNAFPEAYEVDCETEIGDINKLGSISYTKESPVTVVNIYGQFGYGNRKIGKPDIDYDALRSGFKLIKEQFSGKIMGFNRLGSGLAGGDWEIIEQIIEDELEGEDVTVVNYVP